MIEMFIRRRVAGSRRRDALIVLKATLSGIGAAVCWAVALAGLGTSGTNAAPAGSPCVIEGVGQARAAALPAELAAYRPRLAVKADRLPEPATLGDMIATFERLAGDAAAHPGHWEDGEIALGANPRQYVPSDAELLHMAFAERLRRFVDAHDAAHLRAENGGQAWQAAYSRFDIRRVDMAGTGTFLYASAPVATTIGFG